MNQEQRDALLKRKKLLEEDYRDTLQEGRWIRAQIEDVERELARHTVWTCSEEATNGH